MAWHSLAPQEAFARLQASHEGLSGAQAAARLERDGPNALPRRRPPGLGRVFLGQFRSPLIYVLVAAAIVSFAIGAWTDAVFIGAVLLVNAGIGTFQEYRAERAAQALQGLVSSHARVRRDGESVEIAAEEVVVGDLVLLEPGLKVPADLRLVTSNNLTVDESLLTGESLASAKEAATVLASEAVLAERANMAYAGTLVATGRGTGVVVATALATEIGHIAELVAGHAPVKPPLLRRMERFASRIAWGVGAGVAIIAAVELARGGAPGDIFLLAVALAVAAIPEGLPVALTVALAVSMQRMARRNVVVRRLVAVEALGSCTYIGSDKTGTLTVNQLTVQRIAFAGQPAWQVTGEGVSPEGAIVAPGDTSAQDPTLVARLCSAAVLANEAVLIKRQDRWVGQGDAVDVALLVLARKASLEQARALEKSPPLAAIPYESEQRFCASLNRGSGAARISVKGALETLLPMCTRMATSGGDAPLDAEAIVAHANELADAGFRVLALADGETGSAAEKFGRDDLHGLTLLGLVALSDPARPEAAAALAQCRRAGVAVGMITGDHPATAAALARTLGFGGTRDDVVTGDALRAAARESPQAYDALVARATVFARIEPRQKLEIVQSLQRRGHYVAVTGDGVNDAPALRAAHVGVAMGRGGTDVARESSDIVLLDDQFASIVSGIDEGRIAYANVRKVIFLLISTGAAELVLFALALGVGAPLPLVAVQLLWLNLVTNGIQDVALAFEPAEGDELARAPRPPSQPIFDRLMIERVAISALVIGTAAFGAFQWMLAKGHSIEEARNVTLLLMVLAENVQAFNSRSETRSVFAHNPLRNKVLLFGVVAALLLHVAAMYLPGLGTVLGAAPLPPAVWLALLAAALVVLVPLELHKLWARRTTPAQPSSR